MKLPKSPCMAYCLMSIHDHLKQIPAAEIEDLGWSKALELAKVARSEGRHFDCATWLHKAKERTKEELKEEVYKYFTGEDYEPYEMVYFKLFESQLPTVERALYVASRMAGTERSRGYCLELVCADFLAFDEAGAGAGRMAMSKVRVAREPAGAPQDQAEPAR